MRISRDEFIPDWTGNLGPAWTDKHGNPDIELAPGLISFIKIARSMAEHKDYGHIYAVRLDDSAVTPGPWHYDLGEYDENGAERFVGTWASDNYLLNNCYMAPAGNYYLQPYNNVVVAFNEGTDLHRREYVPARPGQSGMFISMALYREEEPANLDCPKLAELRTRGPYADLAKTHRPVTRKEY